MGRTPRSLDTLTGAYKHTMTSMNDNQRMLYRAREADRQHYFTVRKTIRMSDQYMCLDGEMRERLLAEAVRTAEQCRRRDQKTWQQKAASLGFTPGPDGEWDFRSISNSLSSMPMAGTCDTQIREGEITLKGNPSLNAIMGCLSELGNTLNMSELRTIERKVQDLIRADEERSESFDFATTMQTPSPTTAKFLSHLLKVLDLTPTKEYDNKKRKRCDSIGRKEDALCEQATSNKENSEEDSGLRSVLPEHCHIAQLSSTVPKICVAGLNGDKGQPQDNVARTIHNIDEEARPKQLEARKSAVPVDKPVTGECAAQAEKRVKLEGVANLESTKPLRTGFFDSVLW